MKKRFEPGRPDELRHAIMGLGDRSMRKSYFPELQDRLFELQRFRALLDEAPDAILLVRAADRVIADGNHAAWTLAGSDRDLRGLPLSAFCPAVAERLGQGGNLERVIVCHGGGHASRPMELTVREVLFEDEAFLVVVARDVTERLRVEAELRRAKDAAEAANRAKGEFLNLAAHELRTPLTTLKILLGMFRTATLGVEAVGSRLLDRMDRQVRRLGDLANDLVDDLRLEQGTLTLRRETFDLGALIEESVEIFCRERTDCRIELRRPPGSTRACADPGRLAQVLGELLENAYRYGAEGPITVRLLEGSGGQVRVEVEDSGPGVPPEERERIFERLTRGRVEASLAQPGLGLGLHIARQIVELHGGRIGVEAGPGAGSRFWFTLPGEP